MELDILDIALRGAITGGCIVLTSLLWMSRIARDAQIAFSLTAMTIIGRNWSTLPANVVLSDSFIEVMRLTGCFGAVSVTWFLLTIFLDDRRFFWAWIVSGAAISIGVFMTQSMPDIAPYLRSYAVLHFVALLGIVLYSGLDDLQDARRRMRPGMASFLLVYCMGLALTSTPMQDVRPMEEAVGQSVAGIFFLTLFMLWSLKVNLNNWPGQTVPRPANAPDLAQQSSEQSLLVTRIHTAMEGGVWRIEGLTVAALAQKVGAPEHQVRKAINQVLGHRNFASFINRARIDAAKARLHSVEGAESTILEIAYDVGFSSLGPFNRAFREATGQSPTDFRKQRGPEAAA